ncbi:MAG: hypothetical protein IPL79_03485 [Myxococcales bacterium]|nr:hypothetical protein [Myxococcales bacterium]
MLIATVGMALPAVANRRATPATAAAPRPAAAAATKPRVLVATAPRLAVTSKRVAWQTGWQAAPTDSGVTMLRRQSEQLATDGTTTARNIVFTGQTSRVSRSGGGAPTYDFGRLDIGSLVFEPQAAGQHRVLLRMPDDATFEALPTRTSAGATARGSAARRTVNYTGGSARIELVQFFKAAQPGAKRTTYFAAYGEDGLVGADGTKQALTHLINITTRRIVSLPYKFISIWNGTGSSNGYVMVEPLKADGKPDIGKVLGIPIDLLKKDFAGTVASPAKWTVLAGGN